MTTKFIALWANPDNQTTILATGETAEVAIDSALRNLGGEVTANDLTAVPVSARLGAVLDTGYDVTSWYEDDGIADIDFRMPAPKGAKAPKLRQASY